jgi:aryl-alcohol dehydrogenase-like predicted oxidoreductase
MMERIPLGCSEVSASRIVFGAMAIGSARHDMQRRIDTIRAAVDAGITAIDTAPIYDFGRSEETVGHAVAGLRDRVEIFTKVGLRWDDPHGDELFTTLDETGREISVRKNSRPESVRLEVERSLRRLGVDRIDLVSVQQRDPHTPIADTMGALRSLRDEGKLRAIGLSSDFSAAELLEAQRDLGDTPLAAVHVHYSVVDRRHEQALMSVAHERRIGVLAHSSLEMGLLAGKLTPSTTFGGDDLRSKRAVFHPENIRRVTAALQRAVSPVATRHGASVAQVVLAWALAQPPVSAVVVGASWPEQARANAEAAALQLSADELFAIQRVFDHLQLDPHAGLSVAGRIFSHGQRMRAGVQRRLAGTAGRLPSLIGRDTRAGQLADRLLPRSLARPGRFPRIVRKGSPAT